MSSTAKANSKKVDMARVIVQALYNLPSLPAENHREVVKRASRGNASTLRVQHEMALAALKSKQETFVTV